MDPSLPPPAVGLTIAPSPESLAQPTPRIVQQPPIDLPSDVVQQPQLGEKMPQLPIASSTPVASPSTSLPAADESALRPTPSPPATAPSSLPFSHELRLSKLDWVSDEVHAPSVALVADVVAKLNRYLGRVAQLAEQTLRTCLKAATSQSCATANDVY